MLEREARPLVCASSLQIACEMLARSTPETASSVSVTQNRGGSPEEARDVELLGAHLAEQYDLEARIEVTQRSITVIFSRRVAETDSTDPAHGVRWDGHNRRRR